MSPIDYSKYPPEWHAISRDIRTNRAENRCECAGECGLHHDRRCEEVNGEPAKWARGKIILTVAHLNHDPMDCRPENLKAMCQRCHLRYDVEHHKASARKRRHRLQVPLLSALLALALTGCGLLEPDLLHGRFPYDIGTVQVHANDTTLVAVVTDYEIVRGVTVTLPPGTKKVCVHNFDEKGWESVSALVWTAGDDEVEPRWARSRRFPAGVELRVPSDWYASVSDSAITRIDMARWSLEWWEDIPWCD